MAQISQSMPMVYFINGIMEKYRMKSGETVSSQDPAHQFVRSDAVNSIRQTQIVDENEYDIDGRCGQGRWSDCPYVAIMYKKWKKEGVCVAYILSHNYNEVYLTLNQFVNKKDGDKKEKYSKTMPKEELNKNVSDVLKVLGEDVFDFHRGNEGLDFGSKRAEAYKEATILYKKYEVGNVPGESALCNDLANLMKIYRRWIDHCENAQQKGNSTEESEQLNSENASQETSINPNEKISGEVEQEGFLHQNVIFYGVPGCGKSHRINALLHLDDKVNGLEKEYYKRILFHPEYSYSDFVGQLRPEVGDDNKITYKFVPGPFTEILLDAYKDREHDYFLIIEEINRGNAPAIFGDLFQLLDRKDGVSEYSIDNKDILDYFERELEIARESKKDDISAMAQAVETIKREGVRIPENLTIFATMNTCDQNVFTLDTAFKRRWRMCKIKNDTDLFPEWPIFKGDIFTWRNFANAVNDAILKNCSDGTEAEDKQLGAFFVKKDDVKNVQRFAEKVLLYLWDDVAKYDQSQLFDKNKYRTLDEVIDAFVKGENVFSPNCAELQKLYEKMEQSGQAGDSSETEPSTDSLAQNAPEATGEEQGRE